MDTTSGRGVTGSLNVETESDYRVRIETSPKSGTVRLESNGAVTLHAAVRLRGHRHLHGLSGIPRRRQQDRDRHRPRARKLNPSAFRTRRVCCAGEIG